MSLELQRGNIWSLGLKVSDLSLPSGTRLGPFEVTALLGTGGMGEVYRARDTKHPSEHLANPRARV